MSMEIVVPSIDIFDSDILSTIGKELYLSDDFADVHFVFESEDGQLERVPGHKCLMVTASEVFRTMFNGSWKEKDEVKISDTSVEAFKEFLQFFYFGRVKLTEANVATVMDLANQYDIDKCFSICVRYLKNIMNPNNVCWCYGLAVLFDEFDLKEACESMISFTTKDVLKSKSFLESDRKVLESILKMEWLSCSELELFEAFIAWILANSDQNNLTKKLVRVKYRNMFQDIRIGSMKLDEWGIFMRKYKILFTNNEYPDIVQLITDTQYESKIFNSNHVRRSDARPWNDDTYPTCLRLLKYRCIEPYQIKSVETTIFSTSDPLLWTHLIFQRVFEFRGVYYYDISGLPTEVTIVEIAGSGGQQKVLYNGQSKLKSSEPSTITLFNPILVKPGLLYKIELKQNTLLNYVVKFLLRQNVQLDSGTKIQFYRDLALTPERSGTSGLVRGLHFNELSGFSD